MTNNIIIFIHLMAAAIAIGSMVFSVILLLPSIEKVSAQQESEEFSTPYKLVELLAPTVFTCLLILIGTGVYYLLENYTGQVGLKPGYYNLFGLKLICVVIAFFLSIYQTFNLRARIANLDLSPENRKIVPETIQQIKKTTVLVLIVFSLAVFFGIWLARF
jgi:uncharacterized membrane protein